MGLLFFCCQRNCLLGILLGNLSLIAWAFGIQAGYNVFEISLPLPSSPSASSQSDDSTTTTTTAFGLLGYHPNHNNDNHDNDINDYDNIDYDNIEYEYYLKYTVQQEDLFVDILWRLGRYLYFLLGVVGLLQSQLLWVSFCTNGSILSRSTTTQRRYLALICWILAMLPVAIAGILYTSDLCSTRSHHQVSSNVFFDNMMTMTKTMNENINNNNNNVAMEMMMYDDTATAAPANNSTNATGSADFRGGEGMDRRRQRVLFTTTTATTRQEATSFSEQDDDDEAHDEEETNVCTPTEGAMAMWAASALWMICGLLVICCTSTQTSTSSTSRRRRRRQGRNDDTDDDDYYSEDDDINNNNINNNKLRSPLLTPEPLLDPATRTLGWVAKIIVLTLFATVPYWTQAALVAMAPKAHPFLSGSSSSGSSTTTTTTTSTTSTTSMIHTQLLGPTMFNPTQEISYSTEQREWIDPAFEQANILAWVPFIVNLCLALPLVLYGRHRLSQTKFFGSTTTSSSSYNNNNNNNNPRRRRNNQRCSCSCSCSCWPYLLFGLILIQFCMAAICVWIPLSVITELCPSDSKKYPELLYVLDTTDTTTTTTLSWHGTDILSHSAMKANCWPTEMGQILSIGGTLLSLLQAILLLKFSLQYSNAKDTLATFAGIEEDQQQRLLLLSSPGDDDDDEDNNEDDDDNDSPKKKKKKKQHTTNNKKRNGIETKKRYSDNVIDNDNKNNNNEDDYDDDDEDDDSNDSDDKENGMV